MRFLEQLDEFGRLARLPDDIHFRKFAECLSGAEQNHRVVVCDDDLYSLAHLFFPKFGSLTATRNNVK
ncbi:hypothetical protein QCE47_11945 [Caballeronia sp. LZ025]|uniref:hypothetical protein n=1 Tax=Caballeronia TaxID=1827195 RepID=UPI001FD5A74E|nr:MULTISPECIES: hypothetical protein [Caballeronia]MDR5733052.1 hypothetical protein [Caballeronia sp. LZ025]